MTQTHEKQLAEMSETISELEKSASAWEDQVIDLEVKIEQFEELSKK